MTSLPYEEWRVIDRWWTEEPEERHYRARDTGDEWIVTEMLLDEVWIEVYRERFEVPALAPQQGIKPPVNGAAAQHEHRGHA